jgi:hypothetical protein
VARSDNRMGETFDHTLKSCVSVEIVSTGIAAEEP